MANQTIMVSSTDDKAHSPLQLTISTKEISPTISNSPSFERTSDESFEGNGNSSPSTLVCQHAANGFDVDTEALKPPRCSEQARKISMCGDQLDSDSSVWPGQAHWKEKARAAKRKNRSCQCMARLGKRASIAVKITIALLVIGVAVGVGFGISKSV
ncbi:hypothetical protein GGS21DRAFT_496659 [Xylaria nigripes]|nr:hypothetical protein GGS21DRAFT_496659 [Xylaria nigripes]